MGGKQLQQNELGALKMPSLKLPIIKGFSSDNSSVNAESMKVEEVVKVEEESK